MEWLLRAVRCPTSAAISQLAPIAWTVMRCPSARIPINATCAKAAETARSPAAALVRICVDSARPALTAWLACLCHSVLMRTYAEAWAAL